MSGKKKASLTIKQKLEILAEFKNKSKSELCKKYECSLVTLNRIIRTQHAIKSKSTQCQLSAKRERGGACKDVEYALKVWFDQMRCSGAAISSKVLMEKAKQFAIKLNKDFNPTSGWLWCWQKREGIVFRKLHGEESSADAAGANNFKNVVLPELIRGIEEGRLTPLNFSSTVRKQQQQQQQQQLQQQPQQQQQQPRAQFSKLSPKT